MDEHDPGTVLPQAERLSRQITGELLGAIVQTLQIGAASYTTEIQAADGERSLTVNVDMWF